MKGTARLSMSCGGTIEVPADIFGPIAVTRHTELNTAYRITHIETGWALTGAILNKKKAIALAREMNKHPETWMGLSTKRSTRKNKEAALIIKALAEKLGII